MIPPYRNIPENHMVLSSVASTSWIDVYNHFQTDFQSLLKPHMQEVVHIYIQLWFLRLHTNSQPFLSNLFLPAFPAI